MASFGRFDSHTSRFAIHFAFVPSRITKVGKFFQNEINLLIYLGISQKKFIISSFFLSYLILERNKLADGEKALKKLRGTNDIEEELQEIRAEGNNSENSESMSVLQLLTNKKLRLALFITVCMHLSQQLSGIVAIFYYSTKFFEVSLEYFQCSHSIRPTIIYYFLF